MAIEGMNAVYTTLCSRLLFPMHEFVKGHDSLRKREALEASQWWDAQRIREWQSKQLEKFLGTVSQHVPYYRQLFQSLGLTLNDLVTPGVLRAIPPTTKSMMRENTELLKSDRARTLKRFNTGGSTGEPLIFYVGRERVSHDVAAKWRATRWWNVDIGDREVVVWGSPIELKAQDRVRSIRDWILRSRLLPAFDMSRQRLDSYVAAIKSARPTMLFGYPSSLAMIASHAERSETRMDNLGIRVAFVTSERLYEDQRRIISAVFGCAVANGYGGRDAGFVAHECPAGRMHISAEDIIVETLDEAGEPVAPGSSGEIVVTHLGTEDYPFIRYRTGDIGILDESECPCGRGLPVLREIEGRTTDFVVAANGTVMHGLALIYPVREVAGIEQFQIIQHDIRYTEILVVPGPGFDRRGAMYIQKEYQKRLGEDVRVLVREVENISRERNGKFRYVVSRVKSDASGRRAAGLLEPGSD